MTLQEQCDALLAENKELKRSLIKRELERDDAQEYIRKIVDWADKCNGVATIAPRNDPTRLEMALNIWDDSTETNNWLFRHTHPELI
jgi:hypothetical protein